MNCECISELKGINLIVMPGGGMSAVLYAHGILLGLFNSGLLERNGVFNTDNIFIASSGSTLPLWIVLACFHLELNKKHPKIWFEKFVSKTIECITTKIILELYGISQVQSFLDETLTNNYVNNIVTSLSNKGLKLLLPTEFFGHLGIDFKTSEYRHHFKFNYIKILDNYLPVMTDDNIDLTGLNVVDQLKQIFRSCCTINGWSAKRPWQNHDAGLILQNFINCISSYLKMRTLKHLLYFTLTPYNTNSLKPELFRNTLNFNERSSIETNYFIIDYLKSLCVNSGKIFELVSIPTKYDNKLKFNVPIYDKLNSIMNYETDFDSFQRFSGLFGIFHNQEEMYKLVSLFGYYECLNIFKHLNKVNSDNKDKLKDVNYAFMKSLKYDKTQRDVIIDETNANLFHLKSFDLDDNVNEIYDILKYKRFCDKTSYMDRCFINQVENTNILKMYISCMQTTPDIEPDSDYYMKYVPIQKITNPKIFKHPDRYLSKEYKYVSDNCLTIYYPML